MRLIDVDALLSDLSWYGSTPECHSEPTLDQIRNNIKRVPTIEERKEGCWKYDHGTGAWNGDLKAQLSLLCVDVALNGDSRLIKEEKKMLNVDKYRDEIDRMIAIGGAKPSIVITRMCLEKTNLNSIDTAVALGWLFSEHEPQLLENGDGLKPGDWIMVRNARDEDWESRRFICYYNNVFWTLYDNGDWFHIGSKITPWLKARLPMEGE